MIEPMFTNRDLFAFWAKMPLYILTYSFIHYQTQLLPIAWQLVELAVVAMLIVMLILIYRRTK